MTTYHINGSRDSTETPVLYSRQQCFPANTMLHMNPPVSFSATEANVSSASSLMDDIQDFSSWRDQADDDDNNGRNGFPLMRSCITGQGLSLSLSSQILPGIQQMENQNLTFRNNPNINNNISRDEQSRGNNEFATQVFSGLTRTIHNSKYLKAAQELLDEAVNVRKALKKIQPEVDKNDLQEKGRDLSQNLQNSITNPPPPPVEIPHAERQDLQNKLTKLLSILDEVDRRYKQYYQQMQIVVSSFDVIAGCGAAKPYTALALQTISRHFRSLRDAISGQIIVTRKSLEEHDGSDGRGVGISRLRNVDQQVRQQRAMQQLGVMQPPHAWRPQRGLPDNSVLILRAWLFEHFLHPYPKDSDKIMLARQTGLSRGQVSNWFINARVRLWKPMVEEMYKEEFIDTLENDSNLSPEITPKTAAETRPAGDQGQEGSQDQQVGTSSKHNYGHGAGGESCSMVQDAVTCSDQVMVVPLYHVTEMPRLGSSSSGVSLTLGLQNPDSHGNVPMSEIREIDTYQDAIPGSHFGYINPSNRQQQLGSSQLLHDFVERYRAQV